MRRPLPVVRLLAIPIVLALLSVSCSPKYPTAPDPVIVAVQVFYSRTMADAIIGQPYFFNAYAVRSDGAYIDVTSTATWFSSDSQIMRPLANFGGFSPLSAGRVDVGARYQSLSGAVTVSVVNSDRYPRLVVVEGETHWVGEKAQIGVFISYSQYSVQSVSSSVTWTSADPSIVRVDGSTVTALRVGTTVLSTSYNGLTVDYHTSVHPSR